MVRPLLRGIRDFFPPTPPLGVPGDPGLFGPQSTVWRLERERMLLVGGPAALLMQVAHPLVAAGVAEHSDFVADPLRRLRGTLQAVLSVTFGDSNQVQAAVAAVADRHRPVVGHLSDASSSFEAGTPYRADDPELDLWVFATLVWAGVAVLDTFVGRVSAADRDGYYGDMKEFGRRFGAPDDLLPDDFAGLDDYVRRTVRGVLDVGPLAHRLADQILTPEPPLLPAPLRSLPAVLAAGLLPPDLREAYGLPWQGRHRLLFAGLAGVSRVGVRLLPAPVRYWPHFLVALRRVRAGRGR